MVDTPPKIVLKEDIDMDTIDEIYQVIIIGRHTFLKSSDTISTAFKDALTSLQLRKSYYCDIQNQDCYDVYINIHDEDTMYTLIYKRK